MAILPIIIGQDNPVLRQKTVKIAKVTKEIKELAKNMAETMVEANGVGLAAPQVNSNVRMCLAPVNGQVRAMINPKITWKSKEMNTDEEGCLSLPGLYLPVSRHNAITLTYTDINGKPQERKMEGFEARVVQHETDHLDGILIVDHQ